MKKKNVKEKSKNDLALSDTYYRRICGEFSNKLRSLMKENPTLPVVIFPFSSPDEADCFVGYVYNKDTGDFKEKVIAISGRQNNNQGLSDQDDNILPF